MLLIYSKYSSFRRSSLLIFINPSFFIFSNIKYLLHNLLNIKGKNKLFETPSVLLIILYTLHFCSCLYFLFLYCKKSGHHLTPAVRIGDKWAFQKQFKVCLCSLHGTLPVISFQGYIPCSFHQIINSSKITAKFSNFPNICLH